MKLCEPIDCTGCMACYNVCNNNSIDIVQNDEGFYIPRINENTCTSCGICTKTCPVLHPPHINRIDQYGFACWSKDDTIRNESSSGGLFTEIAKQILQNNGIVYGAAFDDNFRVHHRGIELIEEIDLLRGSKYSESFIGDTFAKIKKELVKGRFVLFVGTPCQVAGLHSFLRKSYKNLLTCDFVCHGVPSPKVFSSYKEWLETQNNSVIVKYKFRDKQKGWVRFNTKAIFSSGDIYIGTWFKDPFMRLFLRDNILRKSCYECKYTSMMRMGDITIADYWGYKPKLGECKNTDKGVSLVLVNTSLGADHFNIIKSETTYYSRTAEEVLPTQKSLSSPWPMPLTRELFWKDFNTLNFKEFVDKYAYPEKMNFADIIYEMYGFNIFTNMLAWVFYKFNGIRQRFKSKA